MTSVRPLVLALAGLLTAASAAPAAILPVGPDKPFPVPSRAIAAARPGDVILIDAGGRYDGDVAVIRTPNLTLRGVGGRPRLDAQGRAAADKGIWVQMADNLLVENVEFVGARCKDGNGAGIRGQGRNLVVRGCRFFDCQNGILGGVGEVRIEGCEFDRCGFTTARDPAHSVYIGHECTRLMFQGNYSTHTLEGHLLKSRAAENRVLFNRLTDEDGQGSACTDFPNGGLVVLAGNLLHKGPKGQNDRVVFYGTEGYKHPDNRLYVVSNTMIYQYRRPSPGYVRLAPPPASARVVIRNNLCIGAVPLTDYPQAEAAGNLLLPAPAAARFADPLRFDLRLRPGSPAAGRGVPPPAGAGDEFLAVPDFQYVHPARVERRPPAARPDIGAFAVLTAKPDPKEPR